MARLSVYDPFAEVFPEIFRGLMQPARPPQSEALEARIDVSETPTQYVVQAELPGVKKEDVSVQIDGNRVSISAEARRETEKREGERLLRSERYFGTLARSFALGNEVDEQNAQARLDNGVLTLTLPKKLVPAARKLTIQ